MSTHQSSGREALSCFMDGEIEPAHVDEVVTACRPAGDLREDWTLYHCIGDVLRSADMAAHSSALAQAVSARLAAEPPILAAQRRPAFLFSTRLAASMAAAVAGVAVVAYIALPRWGGSVADPPSLAVAPVEAAFATLPNASKPAAVAPVATAAVPAVSPEFLVAHRQFSGGIAMQGMVGQVRSVALEAGR